MVFNFDPGWCSGPIMNKYYMIVKLMYAAQFATRPQSYMLEQSIYEWGRRHFTSGGPERPETAVTLPLQISVITVMDKTCIHAY